MPIVKVDGRRILDSGSVLVRGDAVIEIRINPGGAEHQVALKFRTQDGEPKVRYGNPEPGRTVVHLVNVLGTQTGGEFPIGKIGDRQLTLLFSVQSFGPQPTIRDLSYTLYADAPAQ